MAYHIYSQVMNSSRKLSNMKRPRHKLWKKRKSQAKECSRHAKALAQQKMQEEARKASNIVLRVQHHAVLQEWSEKKAWTKVEKIKFTEKCPTLDQLPGPILRQKLVEVEEIVESEGEEINLSKDEVLNVSDAE